MPPLRECGYFLLVLLLRESENLQPIIFLRKVQHSNNREIHYSTETATAILVPYTLAACTSSIEKNKINDIQVGGDLLTQHSNNRYCSSVKNQ